MALSEVGHLQGIIHGLYAALIVCRIIISVFGELINGRPQE